MTVSTDIQVLMVILDEVRAIRKDNADFKAEIKQDMQDFKAEVRQDMQDFKQDVNKQLDGFRAELSGVHAEIRQLQTDNVRIQSDLGWLLNIDYWLISVMVGIFVLPHVLNSVTAIFKAVVEGVREIARVFKKGGSAE